MIGIAMIDWHTGGWSLEGLGLSGAVHADTTCLKLESDVVADAVWHVNVETVGKVCLILYVLVYLMTVFVQCRCLQQCAFSVGK
jgi:hypothetical protein